MLSAGEKAIFESFTKFYPNFAGAKVKCEDGPDPPDFICAEESGLRVGVELGEWLNEQQTRESKERERLEDSYCSVLKSEEEEPPRNIGWVYLNSKPGLRLGAEDAVAFKAEFYECIKQTDTGWPNNPERDDPQGHTLRDFAEYPVMGKYLDGLHFQSRERINPIKGIAWADFRPRGGAYSPKDAVAALLELLRKKTNKYASLHREQDLVELYLVVYYDQGLIHNTPYFGLNFGLDEVAKAASAEVAKNPGPFQKIFLFNSIDQDMAVYQLWPQV
ncbi:MAG: hypothetical protein WB952_25670 [Terriglobales bacterium]